MADYNARFLGDPATFYKLISDWPTIGYIETYRVFTSGTSHIHLLRAQDDGYAPTEYTYWFSFSTDTSDAPIPIGTYYNVTIIGDGTYSDGLVNVQFTDTTRPLTEPLYRLRAKDSGKTAPGYTYWAASAVNYNNAPTPVGIYSDLTILSTIEVRA